MASSGRSHDRRVVPSLTRGESSVCIACPFVPSGLRSRGDPWPLAYSACLNPERSCRKFICKAPFAGCMFMCASTASATGKPAGAFLDSSVPAHWCTEQTQPPVCIRGGRIATLEPGGDPLARTGGRVEVHPHVTPTRPLNVLRSRRGAGGPPALRGRAMALRVEPRVSRPIRAVVLDATRPGRCAAGCGRQRPVPVPGARGLIPSGLA